MKYYEIKISSESIPIDIIVDRLCNLGFDSVMINDPSEFNYMLNHLKDTEWYDRDDINDEWLNSMTENPSVTLFLNDDEIRAKKFEEIETAFHEETETGAVELIIKEKDDSEWKDKWKEYFRPTKVSDRIIVAPTWADEEAISDICTGNREEIIIRLDPGQAFGTGTHETTSLTIRLMEKYLNGTPKVLDVGTGSGILAIAAAKLGASEVLGIDIDPESVETAGRNISLNLKEIDTGNSLNKSENIDNFRAVYGDLTEGSDFKADLIVANLLHDLVIRLSGDAAHHLLPNGTFISSGILTEKELPVLDAIRGAGFDILEIMRDGEWSAIAAILP